MSQASADIAVRSETNILELRKADRLAATVKMRPRLIDLFAGAGGMTAGFTHLTAGRGLAMQLEKDHAVYSTSC